MVEIEIDGKKIQAENGEMLIKAADDNGITIPRYCYHKKLSIAANCRMCLVEVEKAPKPLPACATPVADGMKVFTRSPSALNAQRSVMEFLLINHPLDCPICDQGGQCELQDLAVGFGGDRSLYDEGKRAVANENVGPLVETRMTRCIHCSRCIRFGDEIAGLREFGMVHRGEHAKVATYVKHSLRSEVAGNIIDLCPVGALTSKPFLYRGRAWELDAHEAIAPHDCLGSNIYVHTRRNQVMRVVPRENESINETWLADRDRFSYLGANNDERVGKPMIKREGQWHEATWIEALEFAANGLEGVRKQHGAEALGALASASCTVEEYFLLQQLMRSLGSHNIDHRLRETDFSDQKHLPLFPSLGMQIEDLENLNSFLLIGSNIQREQPLAGVRLRKAVVKNQAKAMSVNFLDHTVNFPLSEKLVVAGDALLFELAGIVKALIADQKELQDQTEQLLKSMQPTAEQQAIADKLKQGEKSAIILGAFVQQHPEAATIRALAQLIAQASGSSCGVMSLGANSAGAYVAGMLPHRLAGGAVAEKPGLDAGAMLTGACRSLLLLNVEPAYDAANSALAEQALAKADFVVSLAPYLSNDVREHGDVLLPIATFAENTGTYINVEGVWQTSRAAIKPFQECRPAWKVLRVLGNIFKLDGFEYVCAQDVLNKAQEVIDAANFVEPQWFCPAPIALPKAKTQRIAEWPIYSVDNVVRRAVALQESLHYEQPYGARMNQATANKLSIAGDSEVMVEQANAASICLPLKIDATVPDNAVAIEAGIEATRGLGGAFENITITKRVG